MKKTIGLIVVLIIMLIALTGCAQVNYEITVNSDGSGDISYIYGVEKSVLEQLNVSAEEFVSSMKEQAEDSSYIVESYEDDNISGFKAYKHVDDLSKDLSLEETFGEEYVTDTDDNGIIVKRAYFYTKYSQTAQIDLTSMSDSEGSITMTYKVNLPAKSRTNNATTVSDNGKELVWELKSGETNSIVFEAIKINVGPIIIIGLMVIICIGIIVYIILKKKHVTKN